MWSALVFTFNIMWSALVFTFYIALFIEEITTADSMYIGCVLHEVMQHSESYLTPMQGFR